MTQRACSHVLIYSLVLFKGYLWAARLDAGRLTFGLWELGFLL